MKVGILLRPRVFWLNVGFQEAATFNLKKKKKLYQLNSAYTHTHTHTHTIQNIQVSNGHFQKVTSSLNKNIAKNKTQNLQSTKAQETSCCPGQDPARGLPLLMDETRDLDRTS